MNKKNNKIFLLYFHYFKIFLYNKYVFCILKIIYQANDLFIPFFFFCVCKKTFKQSLQMD